VFKQRCLAQSRLTDQEKAASPAGLRTVEQLTDRVDRSAAIDKRRQPPLRRVRTGTNRSQIDLPANQRVPR
jgi:hypothetical protein